MFKTNSDVEWEKFGQIDPYFGVVTHDEYQKENLTFEKKEKFFKSGYIYVDKMLNKIREHVAPQFTPKQALDFGCGVGRLVIPLSKIAENVTGIDVSDSMLQEAKNNCEARSIRNVHFVKGDDSLSSLNGKFDLIHSFIVFQHIPVKRGERIFKNLLAHLKEGGVGVLHITYANGLNTGKIKPLIRNYFPLGNNIINLLKGKRFFAPHMQMNNYNLNKLLFIIQKFKVREFYAEYTSHRGALGTILYFKKPESA